MTPILVADAALRHQIDDADGWFKDRITHFPDVKDRIIRYMIVAGEVVLERRTKRRAR